MVVDHAQIRDNVLDFLALIEAQTADNLIGNARTDEGILYGIRLCVHAVQDGMVRESLSFCCIFQNGVRDKSRLVLLGLCAIHLDLTAFLILCPQCFSLALGIMLDDRIGCLQNGLGATVVLLKANDLGITVLIFKVQNIFDGRSAEFIDTLVIIADHADVVVSGRQQAHQQELGVVGILILIHHDVAEAVAVFFQNVRELLEQLDRQHNDVVEVQCIGCLQALLVKLINLRHDFLTIISARFAQQVLCGHHLVLSGADGGKDSFRSHRLFLDIQLLERILDDTNRVIGIIHRKAPVVPQILNLSAQDSHARRMEGGGLNIQCLFAEHRFQTLLEFSCRFVGKGNGKDIPWSYRTVCNDSGQTLPGDVTVIQLIIQICLQKCQILFSHPGRDIVAVIGVAILHHICDAVDNNGCFSAACTCQNEDRTLCLKNSLPLLIVHFGKALFQNCPAELYELIFECLCHRSIKPFCLTFLHLRLFFEPSLYHIFTGKSIVNLPELFAPCTARFSLCCLYLTKFVPAFKLEELRSA